MPEAEQGWVERTVIADMLKVKVPLIATYMARARQQIADMEIAHPSRIVECRSTRGPIRFGIAEVTEGSLDDSPVRRPASLCDTRDRNDSEIASSRVREAGRSGSRREEPGRATVRSRIKHCDLVCEAFAPGTDGGSMLGLCTSTQR